MVLKVDLSLHWLIPVLELPTIRTVHSLFLPSPSLSPSLHFSLSLSLLFPISHSPSSLSPSPSSPLPSIFSRSPSRFPPPFLPTEDAYRIDAEVDGEVVGLDILDTAGQVRLTLLTCVVHVVQVCKCHLCSACSVCIYLYSTSHLYSACTEQLLMAVVYTLSRVQNETHFDILLVSLFM